MKLFTAIFATVLSLFGPRAYAIDLLRCATSGEDRKSEFRVFETPTGYGFEVKSCDSGMTCTMKSGPINREITPDSPAMTFSGSEVRIIHFFGEYRFSDTDSSTPTRFPDEGCALDHGSDFVARGEEQRTYAPCGSHPGVAKYLARKNAEARCGSLVLQIGTYHIESQCSETQETLIVRSIFRCLH